MTPPDPACSGCSSCSPGYNAEDLESQGALALRLQGTNPLQSFEAPLCRHLGSVLKLQALVNLVRFRASRPARATPDLRREALIGFTLTMLTPLVLSTGLITETSAQPIPQARTERAMASKTARTTASLHRRFLSSCLHGSLTAVVNCLHVAGSNNCPSRGDS